MALVPLTQGRVAVIDADMVDLIASFNWYFKEARGLGYASCDRYVDGLRRAVYMHRVVMRAAGKGLDVDHINGDGLDNRRANLRVCTRQQNLANRRASRKNRVGLKGVWERNGSYRASIQIGGKTQHIGPFSTAEEAAEAYIKAAQAAHGDFARIHA